MTAFGVFPSARSGPNGITQRSLGIPAAAYPGRVATNSDLIVAVDRQQTTLLAPLGVTDTTMTVLNPSMIVAYNLLSIDDEIVKTTGPAAGNIIPISRGFDGTTPATHLSSAPVTGLVDAWHHNALVAEIEAIEGFLGPNGQNLNLSGVNYFVVSKQYDFAAQQPGGSLAPGNNSITLSPVPKGVNGTDQNHYLYVSGGTGAAEAVLITGGTAVSGAASGALIVNCANAHSGAWSITSSSAGIAEALQTQVTIGAGGLIWIPTGTHNVYAPVRVNGGGYRFQGFGINTTTIQFQDTGSLNCFEFIGASAQQFNGISGLAIYGVSSGGAATKAGGSMIMLTNQNYFTASNLFIEYPVTGITSNNSGWVLENVNVREPKPSTGVGILVNGTGAFDNYIRHFTCDASAAYRAGIEVVASGFLMIDRCDIIHASYDLLVDPGNGQSVTSLDAVGTYFDTPYGSGVSIAPTGTGVVERCRFIDCWTSSSIAPGGGAGFLITPSGTAAIDGILIEGHQAFFNNQQGLSINATATTVVNNITVRNSIFSGNSYSSPGTYDGVAVGYPVSHFTFTGNVSSQTSGTPNTQSRGLTLFGPGATDNVVILDNDLSANQNGPLLDQTTGSNKIIKNNLGIDNMPPPAVASAASIALPTTGAPIFSLTGTAAVTTITGGWNGRQITLLKTDAGSIAIGGGGNIPLAHTLAQNASLILTYNGSAWI